MSSTIDEMKGSLKNAADLTLWTHHHPWMSVGVAAAGGFTLASMFKGTTSDGLKSMMGGSAAVNANSESSVAAAENGQTKSLMGSLFNLARTALEATLVSAIRAEGISRAAQPQPPEPQPLAPSQTPKAQYSQSTYSEPLQHSVAH